MAKVRSPISNQMVEIPDEEMAEGEVDQSAKIADLQAQLSAANATIAGKDVIITDLRSRCDALEADKVYLMTTKAPKSTSPTVMTTPSMGYTVSIQRGHDGRATALDLIPRGKLNG